jgi:hypothetical protein
MIKMIRDFRAANRATEEEAEIQHLQHIQLAHKRHQPQPLQATAPPTCPPTAPNHPSTCQLNNMSCHSDALLADIDKKKQLKEAHEGG